MDFNRLIARVKAILLTPKTEWPVIAGEPATTADLYKNYIVILAAIPAIFGFLKMSLIGVSMPFAGTMRIGVMAGLANMVVIYGLSLLMVYVMALIINALAPTFDAQKDPTQALKTVAYAYTASWIAGFAQILPWLGVLIGIAGGIYGIYLLYLGLPHTMKCPPHKAAGYTVVAIIIAIVLGFVVGLLAGAITGVGAMMSGGSYSASDSDDVEFDKDSPLGKLEQWSKEVEKAGKQMEAAEESGDQQAQADAMKALMGAALGGGAVESLDPQRLKAFLPDSIDGKPRGDVSVQRNGAMGLQISEARATYADESGESFQLEITDSGSAKGLVALAGWAGIEEERETSTGYEKTYRENGRLIHEEWSGNRGEFVTVVGDRFAVKVSGEASSIDDLKDALSDVDLDGLEKLKNEGVQTN